MQDERKDDRNALTVSEKLKKLNRETAANKDKNSYNSTPSLYTKNKSRGCFGFLRIFNTRSTGYVPIEEPKQDSFLPKL
jgi:hypothetical protein